MGKSLNMKWYGIMRYARSVAGDAGLSLRMDKDCKIPHTSTTEIVMPLYDITWEDRSEESIRWWSSLIHETYHHLHKEDFVTSAKYGISADSFLGMVMNIVVDHNIERHEWGEYTGRDMVMQERFNNILPKIKGKDKGDDKINAIIALALLDASCRQEWMELDSHINIFKEADKSIMDLYKKIEHLKDEYAEARPDGDSNLDMTLKILDNLGMDIEEIKKEDMKNPEGDGDGSSKESRGEGKGSSSKKGGDEKEDSSTGISIKKYKEIEEEFGLNQKSHYLGKKKMFLEYSDDDFKQPTAYVPSKPEVIKYHGGGLDTWQEGYRKKIAEASVNQLPKKIRRELKVLSTSRMIGNQQRGKIHKKTVSRVAAGTSDRVFKKKFQKDILDTAICLLVDQSGSMQGTPYIHAAASAIMMNECFSKLQIPTEVISFTDRLNRAKFTIHKEYGNILSNEKLIESLAWSSSSMNNNPDGEAILFAFGRLASRKEKRKLLFVLSDGCPASHCGIGNIYGFTKQVIEQIEGGRYVEIYGIGLEDNNVERLYKKHIVINKIGELETKLLQLIKRSILK